MRFRRLLAAILVSLVAAVALPAFADEATAVAQARSAINGHDYAGAVTVLSAEIAGGSKSAEVYSLRCLALGQLDKANDALSDCNQAIAFDPNYADAYKVRGDLYLDHFDAAKSLKDLDTFLAMQPGDVNGLWSRCDARRRTNDIAGATDDCTQAAKLLPNSGAIRISLGRLALIGKKYADAYDDFSFAIGRDPRGVVALYWRGYTSLQTEDYDKAIADFTSGIANGDTSADVYENRANAYLGLGNKTAGLADWEKAVEITRQQGDCMGAMRMTVMETLLFDVKNITITMCSK